MAAATGLGSMFLSRLLGRMGGPRPRGWACAGLPSCSFLGLGRVGGPRPRGWALTGLLSCSFWAPGSDGWAAATLFLSLLGWAGRGKKAGLPKGLPSHFLSGPRSCAPVGLGLDGWAAAKKLGSLLPGWVGWVRQQFGLSLGMWVGWLGRSQEAGFRWAPFTLLSLWVAAKKLGLHWASYISFLGSSESVGWVGRGQEAGLPSYLAGSDGVGCGQRAGFVWGPGSAAARKLGSRWAPFILPSFWVLGRMGGPRQKGWALRAPFIFRLLGRMGGLRPRCWARIGLPSSFLGSWAHGWAGLGTLHVSLLGCWVGFQRS